MKHVKSAIYGLTLDLFDGASKFCAAQYERTIKAATSSLWSINLPR